jgi:hypothetical protein
MGNRESGIVKSAREKIIKWTLTSLSVGILPIIIRIGVFFIENDKTGLCILNIGDLIAFGLILNVSNIYEIQNINSYPDTHKTIYSAFCVLLIIFFSLFYGLSIDNEVSNRFNNRILIALIYNTHYTYNYYFY